MELKIVNECEYNVNELTSILDNSYIETVFELTFHRKIGNDRDMYDRIIIHYRFNKSEECVNISTMSDMDFIKTHNDVQYIDAYDLYVIYGKEIYNEILDFNSEYIYDLRDIEMKSCENINIKGEKVMAKLIEYKLLTEL